MTAAGPTPPTQASPATPTQVASPRRPGAVTFFAIGAIVVGAFIVLSAIGHLTTPTMLKLQGGLTDPGLTKGGEAVREHYARMVAIVESRHQFLLVAGAVGLVVATGLIGGGIGCLSMRRLARSILIAGCALGLVLELATIVPMVSMQKEMADATAAFMQNMIAGMPSGNPATGFMKASQSFMANAGVWSVAVWSLARAAFEAAAIIYLFRQSTARVFVR